MVLVCIENEFCAHISGPFDFVCATPHNLIRAYMGYRQISTKLEPFKKEPTHHIVSH